MRWNTWLLLAALGLASSGTARAEDLTVALNNVSAKAIVALYATPKGETATVPPVNLLQSGGIPAAGTGAITITQVEPTCVYELAILFADDTRVDRPDVDLCHTDALVIE